MFKLKGKSTVEGAEFCERCSSVCDQACRANQAREHARLNTLHHGMRF